MSNLCMRSLINLSRTLISISKYLGTNSNEMD